MEFMYKITLSLFTILLFSCCLHTQTNQDYKFEEFSKEILQKQDYNFKTYSKYIKFYNEVSKTNDKFFDDYFKKIKFMSINSVNTKLTGHKIEIIDISANDTLINKYLNLKNRKIDSLKIFLVMADKQFVTAIITNKEGYIISFFSKISKKDNRHTPWFLDEKLE